MAEKINAEEARKLHAQGMSDGDIARHFNVTQSSATRWRQKQGLQPNVIVENSRLSPERRRLARKLFREGATREQVRKATGCSKRTADRLRKELAGDERLRPTGKHLKGERGLARRDAMALLSELKAATRHVPDPTIRDDVMGDMFLDMMEGRLSRDLIKSEARRYSSRAIGQWQSRWAPASLDEDLTGDGFRLADLIACPNAAAWLESVGA